MKTKRKLSGIYFRGKNEEGKFEPICFEDLPREKQEEILSSLSFEFVKNLAIQLADTLNEVADALDIYKEDVLYDPYEKQKEKDEGKDH